MVPRRALWKVLMFLVVIGTFLVVACGQTAAPPAAAPTATSAPPAAENSAFKLAMILPGSVQDSDYNFLGFQALKDTENKLGVKTGYQEQVAPADAERVARGFMDEGYNIIAFHGGQFLTAAKKLATENPNVTFIIESGGKLPDLPNNVWNIGRKYYQGFYPLGTMAAMVTKTKKIGIISGIQLPDFIASVNAIQMAAKEVDPSIKVVHTFTGDQNDSVKANQAAQAQLTEGVDVIILVVNLGAYGVIDAVKGKDVLVTTYYTDKTELAPENFAASLLFDFGTPYSEVTKQIIAGTRSGYIELRPGAGMSLAPFHNIPDDVAQKTQAQFDEIVKGTKELQEIADKVQVGSSRVDLQACKLEYSIVSPK